VSTAVHTTRLPVFTPAPRTRSICSRRAGSRWLPCVSPCPTLDISSGERRLDKTEREQLRFNIRQISITPTNDLPPSNGRRVNAATRGMADDSDNLLLEDFCALACRSPPRTFVFSAGGRVGVTFIRRSVPGLALRSRRTVNSLYNCPYGLPTAIPLSAPLLFMTPQPPPRLQ